MKFRQGQVFDKFRVDGKEVVLRAPKRSDLRGCLNHINSLVKEKAYIAMQKKKTLKEEREWMKEALKTLKKGDIVHVLVVMDGKIIGSAGIEGSPPGANRHVAKVGLGLSKGRRLGVGTRVMRTLERIARKHFRSKILTLTCYEKNKPAMGLYRKVGFRRTGVIPRGCNYYGKYMDELIMCKELK